MPIHLDRLPLDTTGKQRRRMTIGPFDHPILGGLLGDDEIAGFFSADAENATMLAFEIALAKAEALVGLIPSAAATRIEIAARAFEPDLKALRQAVAVDGVVVPEFVRQLRAEVGGDAARHLHFGATSQDVIDTSLMLRLKQALAILGRRLEALLEALDALDRRDGGNPLMAKTRMQPAVGIMVGDRISAWQGPLRRSLERLNRATETCLPVQFGGAAGTLDKLGGKAPAVRAALAAELGLADAPQWHSQRDRLVELAGIFSLITGAIGKFGQDIALMAQAGDEIELAGGGRSSAMAHKQNPVVAETMTTLARFNAALLAGMHTTLVHEQERSGAAWTLEWMLLPQMTCATGTALRLAIRLASQINRLGKLQGS